MFLVKAKLIFQEVGMYKKQMRETLLNRGNVSNKISMMVYPQTEPFSLYCDKNMNAIFVREDGKVPQEKPKK